MTEYSISEVEKLTGIRAHTLRAWEQRFDLVTPRRDENNVRYYLEKDVQELSTIALLKRNGYRIGKIAEMPPQARTRALGSITSLNIDPTTQLDTLSLATLEMDPDKFSLIVDTNIEQRGFEDTMTKIIYPLLDKLGLLYFTRSVTAAHESFAGALIRQKILAATDALPPSFGACRPRFALFAPEGEQQELSLLYVQYLLRKRGFPVIYLSTGVSGRDLVDLCRSTGIDYFLTILSSTFVAKPVDELIDEILDQCSEVELLLTGQQARLHGSPHRDRLHVVSGLSQLLKFVEGISTREDRSIALAR